MKRRIQVGRPLLAIGLLTALCLSTPAPVSAADPGTRLPFGGFSDMEVDGATGHVFITGGTSAAHGGSYLAVFDAGGSYLQKVDATGSAAELAIDEAARRIYVALPYRKRIAVVDLDTLTRIDSFATPSDSPGPRSLALIGGRLWFGFGDWFQDPGGIGSVNLATRVVHTFIDQSAYPSYDPELVGSSASGLLVTAEEGLSPVHLRVFDVSSGKPVALADRWDPGGEGFGLGEMRLNDTGRRLLLGLGGPAEVQRYRLPSLAPATSLPTTYGVDALGGTSPGPIVAGQFNRDGGSPALVMDGRTGTPISSTTYDQDFRFPARGLAFSADRARLYVITHPTFGNDRLHVVANPTKVDASLTIQASSPAYAGETIGLHGILSYLDGSRPDGRALSVFRQDPDGTTAPLDVLFGVDSDGRWSVTDELPAVRGTYRYTVGVASDATHDGTTASVYVQALGSTTALHLDASDTTLAQGGSVTLSAHLDAAQQTTNQDVEIWAWPAGSAQSVVAQGSFDASGDFSATVQSLTVNTSFTAMWEGDATYEPAESSPVGVGVARTLTGTLDLASGMDGNAALYPYADDCTASRYVGCPYMTVTVQPATQQSGACFEVQQRVDGTWSDRPGWPNCLSLRQTTTTIVLGTPGPGIVGVPLRIRATAPDDWQNLGATTGWLPFEITGDPPTTLTEPYTYHLAL